MIDERDSMYRNREAICEFFAAIDIAEYNDIVQAAPKDKIKRMISTLNAKRNLTETIRNDPKKLGVFSIRLINSIANSFLGVPSATIIIAADHILTGATALTLTTPDKIFILALAIAILITYTMLAYRLEAKKTETEAVDLTPAMDRLLELMRLVVPESKTSYQIELEATQLIIYCDNLHKGNNPLPVLEGVNDETLIEISNIEKKFAVSITTNRKEAYKKLYLAMCACDDKDRSDTGIATTETSCQQYLSSYEKLRKKISPLRHDQIKQSIKRAALETTYQDKYAKIGNRLGIVNAVVNGLLTCTIGISGLSAFLIIFFPAFSMPLTVSIPLAVVLFSAGSYHSATLTRAFIKSSFSAFGRIYDEQALHNATDNPLWSLLKKNIKTIAISTVVSITFTTLAVASILKFSAFAVLPTALIAVMAIAIATLTFITAVSAYNIIIMTEKQNKDSETVVANNLLSDEVREKNQKSQQKQQQHIIVSLAATIVVGAIVSIVAPSVGAILAIMIALSIGSLCYISTGYYDNKVILAAKNPNNRDKNDIIRYRVRVCLATTIGIAFALSSGPSIATLIFSALTPISAILAVVTSIAVGIVVAAAIFYAVPLVYWQTALKPESRYAELKIDPLCVNNTTTDREMESDQFTHNEYLRGDQPPRPQDQRENNCVELARDSLLSSDNAEERI